MRYCINHVYGLILAAFLTIGLSANAQEIAVPKKGGFFRIITGGSFVGLTPINDALDAKGLAPITNGLVPLGVGLEFWRKRFSFGVDGYLTMAKFQQRQVQPVTLNYSYGIAKIGYAIYQDGDYASIHPTIGFGWGRNRIRERDNRSREFINHFGQGIVGEIAITGRRYYILEGEESTYHGEMGLTIGYLVSPADQWNIAGFTTDSSGLVLPPDGFFFRITIGMGNWRK